MSEAVRAPGVYEEERGDISVGVVGDAFVTRPMAVHREPVYLGMVEVLRRADVTAANCETLFHRYEGFPTPNSGVNGTYAACAPEVIDDLKWMGIDMLGTANNHSSDFGELGVLANVDNLKAAGMAHAGTGASLDEAAAPGYLDTPKGSVALIALTITMPAGDQRAGRALGVTRARPGANVIRHDLKCEVPEDTFAQIRALGDELELGRHFRDGDDQAVLFGRSFIRGSRFHKAMVPNPRDLELNLNSIRGARKLADWVIVSVHHHEAGSSAEFPSKLGEDVCRACIDAGADVVFGHGPHKLRGIEIYKGRPIFYSLGDFILHNDLIKWQPAELYWRNNLDGFESVGSLYDMRSSGDTTGMPADRWNFLSAVGVVKFERHQLKEVLLHPLDLGFDTHRRSMRGRPVLAEGDVAQEVLKRVRDSSKPYGTRVEIDGDRGVIRVDGTA